MNKDLQLIEFPHEQIFIAGIAGSGKTYYAKKYAERYNKVYISFDTFCIYEVLTNPADIVQKLFLELYALVPNFITDGIPFSWINNERISSFFINHYSVKNKVIKIIWVCCTNKEEWLSRIKDRPTDPTNLFKLYFFYYFIYLEGFLNNKSFDNLFYDSFTNEYISLDELYRRIGWVKPMLEFQNIDIPFVVKYLNYQTYDKYYQDIECIDFIGYSKSYISWENIKSLIEVESSLQLLDWKNKIVVDLGPFHGYFCFKIEKEGAKEVFGLEKYDDVLTMTSLIKKINGSRVTFKQWNSGESIPKCDIVLCMNVLHHFTQQDEVLKEISQKCSQVIFEINKTQIYLIKKYFIIDKEVVSHREGRVMLLCHKN